MTVPGHAGPRVAERPGGWTAAWAGVFAALAASVAAVLTAASAIAPSIGAWMEVEAEATALQNDTPDHALLAQFHVLVDWGERCSAAVLPWAAACGVAAAFVVVAALGATRGGRVTAKALRVGLVALAVVAGVSYAALRRQLLGRWDADAAAARDALGALWRSGLGESLPADAARWLSRSAGEVYVGVPLALVAFGSLALLALHARRSVSAWQSELRATRAG